MKRIIRYASDIHLEMSPHVSTSPKVTSIYEFQEDPSCEYYLALVGDIGSPLKPNYTEFLGKCSQKFKQVFVLSGNHEYYCPTTKYSITTIDQKIEAIAQQFGNVHFLNNKTYQLESTTGGCTYKVIGSTLWSNVPQEDSNYISKSINDYNYIYVENEDPQGKDPLRRVKVSDTNQLNKECVEYIERELATCKEGEKVIILSHHAPLYGDASKNQYLAHPQYWNGANNSAFHNDLSRLMKAPIHSWIYGHTHYCSKFKFNNVIIATNQTGYIFEKVDGYSSMEHIELE